MSLRIQVPLVLQIVAVLIADVEADELRATGRPFVRGEFSLVCAAKGTVRSADAAAKVRFNIVASKPCLDGAKTPLSPSGSQCRHVEIGSRDSKLSR
jgi:hypothetical protein